MPVIIDLSSNNGHPIDYQAAKDYGVIASIVKATDGQGYVNPYYNADVGGFTAVGVPCIAYHFAEFTDPASEAAHFVSVAGWRARVLDSETNSDVGWQNAFLAALNLPGNEELDYGSASTLPRGGIRSLLWPASYGRNYGFGDAWQYTDALQIPGIPGLTDGSVWLGSPGDFDSLFNLNFNPPPPPYVGCPTRIPGQEDLMVVDFSTTTGTDGTAYVEIPVPAGTSRCVAASADVLRDDSFSPPAHDGDLVRPASTFNDPSGVVVQPAVPVRNGAQLVRISGAIPGHFYTGHAVFA